ncbi:hypothetical protein L484_024769 [Morus notabilis]|uniref:Uncharacterized protein n=1 Tax=Morus notabilis TaxID=981085 RepID=W9R6X0_9ROSA|nr:auxin-responsive protein SAUR15 [Morus notabilis]EXB56232.1 hypothetical protein L484_024769 [Morus notabilis]
MVWPYRWCGAKGFDRTEYESENDDDGYVGVYVGRNNMEMCKLKMEANFLNHPLFEDLLQLSEEEFGYSYEGALRIACDLHLFQHLLHLLRSGSPSVHYLQLPDLISNFYNNSSSTTIITK